MSCGWQNVSTRGACKAPAAQLFSSPVCQRKLRLDYYVTLRAKLCALHVAGVRLGWPTLHK